MESSPQITKKHRKNKNTPNSNSKKSSKNLESAPLEPPQDDIDTLPPLLTAAAKGDILSLRSLLGDEMESNGKSENESRESEEEESVSTITDSQKRTALHWACLNGHEECAQYLLDSKADINANDLHGRTPLHFAVMKNHSTLCELLLKSGAKMGSRSKDSEGRNPLMSSILFSSFETLSALLQFAKPEHLEEVDNRGRSILHLAAAHEDPRFLRHLIDNENIEDEAKESLLSLLSSCDARNQTPLHLASDNNRHDNLKLLLDKGAKVNAKDSRGNTPLHLAAKKSFRPLVATLVNFKANVMTMNKAKETPLHLSSASGNDDVCHILSTNGGDIAIRYAYQENHLRTPQAENYELNRYGFIVKEHSKLSGEHLKLEEKRLEKEIKRAQKWAKMMGFKFEESGAVFHSWEKEPDKLKRRMGKGIPDSVRWQAWKLLSTCKQLKDDSQVSYQEIKAKKSPKWTEQIDKDVLRTQRDHLMFHERFSIGQIALFNVLKAYSVYDKEVGYCQGMSGLTAVILMYIEEEDAFWMVVQLWTNPKYRLRETFKDGFPLARKAMWIFFELMKKKLPKLFKHFERQSVGETFMFRWFLMVFHGAFPFPVFLRIWDLFLYEGYDIVYTIAYGTLKFFEDVLLRMDMEGILEFFQSLSNKMEVDVDVFVDYILKHRVSNKVIKRLENQYAEREKE